MKYPLTLPPCLIEAAKLLFPTLDFSRIEFYYKKGAPEPLTYVYWNRTEIVLNGTAPRWAKDPCQLETFIILCHELVHALQGQHRVIAHRAASYTCGWLHGKGKESQNCVEREAYDYESQLRDRLKRGEGLFISPCLCANDGIGDFAASLAINNPAFAIAVANDPSIVKRSAGCTAWDCTGSGGPVTAIWRHIVAAGGTVLAAASYFVDDIPSVIGASIGGASGAAAGAIVGWSTLGPLGGIAGWVIGLVVGALIVSFIIQIGSWIVNLFGDDGGALNMMFSTDGGRTFDKKVSFERSCEPMSLSFGKKSRPPGTEPPDLDRLAVAWTGMDNQVNLLTLPINQSEPFKHRATFEESEDCGPAVTHIGVRLHVFWQGADNRLNGVTTTDGITLANKYVLPTLSPDDASPAICVANGRAVMTYIGTDRHINLISSQNGIDWGRKITVFEEAEEDSTVAVTATGVTGSFAMAWTGTDSDHHLNVMQMHVDATTGIITPGAKFVLNDTSATDAGPALTFANGLLCLAWTGRSGHVNFMTSRDFGATFGGKVTLSEESRSDCGPALAVREAESGEIPAIICIGWTGTG